MEENITRIKIDSSPETPPEKVETQETPETPVEETKQPEVVAEAEAPKAPEIDVNSILKEQIGMTADEIKNLKSEYESLKGKPYVDDPELVPDDDFLKDFIATYKRGGDVIKYIEAKKTDFGKMSDEEIVKYEIRRDNPGLPEKFLERKYNDYLRKEFGFQDEYENEEDGQYAKELLRLHANEKRAQFSDELKKFQVPERKAIETPKPDENAEKLVEEFTRFVNENQVTKSISESQKIVFDDFNYGVKADELKKMALDSNSFFALFANKDGNIDLDKFYKVAAIAQDPETFLKARDAHVIAKAKIEWLKEDKNPSIDHKVKPPGGGGEVKIRIV